MSNAKATIVAAVISSVLLGVVQLSGYFINKKAEQPITVWNNFNSGFQGVMNNFSDRKTESLPAAVETFADTPVSSSQSKRLAESEFPRGTLGVLTKNTSLLDSATWKLDDAPGDRTLEIVFKVSGRKLDNSEGSITARLIDSNNRIICTVTAVAIAQSHFNEFSDSCLINSYVIPANSSITLRSEVKTDNAKIVDVYLRSVEAFAR